MKLDPVLYHPHCIFTVTKFRDLAKFGTPENPQGITIYDKAGKPACIRVEDAESGKVEVLFGECYLDK